MEEPQGPSIPSNYVTLLQLKQRWLQQQSTPQPAPKIPNPILNQLKPDDDSAAKIAIEPVPGTNRNRIVNQLDDSASKTVADNNHSIVQKQHHNTNQSHSKLSTKKKGSRNPRFLTGQNQTGGSTPEPVQEKKQHRYNERRLNRNQEVREPEPEPGQDNHSILKKQVHKPDQSNKNSSSCRNPRFLTGQNQTGGSMPEPKKQQHRYNEVRRERSEEVWEPKGKTAPFGQNVSQNDSGGDGVVEAVAVKEMNASNVSRRTTGSGGSGRFNGGTKYRPPIPAKKGQMTGVWVKKGESAPN